MICAAAAVMLLPAPAAVSAAKTAAPAENKPHETTDTLSSVASVSKMFAVTAVMQLADAGKVDPDAPVTEYLPDFKLADNRFRNITVRMLMNHSSGLMGSCYANTVLYADRSTEAYDNLLRHLSAERLKAEPGAYGCYCNDGFDLLALIVEQVSGESITDYIEQHICKPLNMQQTGTAWNAFLADEHMKVYTNGAEFPPEYDMMVGAGGVLSTAPELSQFGTAFFTGNTVLLSEKSKNEMKQCYAADEYEDGFGLGWDTVGDADYTAAGVQVVSKGGDLIHQHAELYVAPDAEISIGVTCSGGSSADAKQLAAALMDIALEEQGISVTHGKPQQKKTADTVPEKYLQYEGLYIDGTNLYQVSFPEGKYMEIRLRTSDRTQKECFLYTDEDSFIRVEGSVLSGNAVQTAEPESAVFCERNGNVYIASELWSGDESIGYDCTKCYYLQKTEPNPLSQKVQNAWEARNGKRYYIYNETYSSAGYNGSQVLPLFVSSGYAGNLKIMDADRAETIVSIPSSTSRDQSDMTFYTENGAEFLSLPDRGSVYISEDAIPDLPQNISEIRLTSGAASWYNIGSGAGRSVTLDIPEQTAVYVYDKHDNVIYSSYMKHYGNTVFLPENGKIVLIGGAGAVVGIRQT